MVKIVQLEEVRKEKSDDSNDWSLIDALKRAITLIESGEFPADRLVISMFYGDENDELQRYRVMAGVSHLEALGLLQQTIFDLCTAGTEDGDELSG
jgi:hypothetical protein